MVLPGESWLGRCAGGDVPGALAALSAAATPTRVAGASPCVFFFFSSRRRHTRCSRDWSSDVCSSDLFVAEHADQCGVGVEDAALGRGDVDAFPESFEELGEAGFIPPQSGNVARENRSEERRVGKECRSRWSPYH